MNELYLKSFSEMVERALKFGGWKKVAGSAVTIEVEFGTEKEQKFSSFTSSQPVYDWYLATTQSYFYKNGIAQLGGYTTSPNVAVSQSFASKTESRTATNSWLNVTLFDSIGGKKNTRWQTRARLDDSATDPRLTFARLLMCELSAFGVELKNQQTFWQSKNDPRLEYLQGDDQAISHLFPAAAVEELKGKFVDFTDRKSQMLETKSGYTVIQLASKFGIIPLIEAFLAAGADINFHNVHGSVLRVAVEARRKDVVTLLVSKGAKMNEQVRDRQKKFSDPVSIIRAIKNWNLYDGELPKN
ncbi:hypothetical protein BH10BDE1_BH10BDE1_23470 [soil metagenome]